MLTDSHCHLDGPKFAGDLDAVLARAAAAGITRILCIGTGDGPPELDRAIRLADQHPQIYATVGVHPHDAAKATPETIPNLRALARHPKVVAIGEIGLDYHYDFSPRDIQRQVFIDQLELASELDLPITIHTREAWQDTIDILTDHPGHDRARNRARGDAPFRRVLPGIMHCFTGDATQAKQALELNFHLAFGGVITFKTADAIREAAALTPDDRLLIETDAPYLAPIPWRGKRNEPSFITQTVLKLAEVRKTTPEHIAAITSANFERLCLQPVRPNRYTGDSV